MSYITLSFFPSSYHTTAQFYLNILYCCDYISQFVAIQIRKIRASFYHYQHSFLTVPIILNYILRVPLVGTMKGYRRPHGDLLFFHYHTYKFSN